MKTNYMLEYNKLIEQIVEEFATRYYKECFNEDETDYRLMDYQWINQWPLEICDEFYCIDDILMTIKFNIPLKIVRERYNKNLDWYMEDKPLWINLYNYALREINPKRYEAKEKRELKQSEENVDKAKEELFNCLKK